MRTQIEWAIAQLKEYGRLTRNEALRERITRLGAIICSLNKQGWEIKGRWEKTKLGRDYVYEVIRMPFKRVEYYIPDINQKVVRYEKIAI